MMFKAFGAGAAVTALVVALCWAYEQGWSGNQAVHDAKRVQALRVEIAKLDSSYVGDSTRAASALLEYRVKRETDTLTVEVPVRVPGKPDTVERVVYVPRVVADSAVNSCAATLNACDIRVALRDTLIAKLQRSTGSKAPVRTRPYSVSLFYLPLDRDVGAMVQRDFWRVRASAGVVTARVDSSSRKEARVFLGLGWNW